MAKYRHSIRGLMREIGTVKGPAPRLGMHTEEIMVEAAYSAAEIQELFIHGVVVSASHQ